ncbi:chymotrypsin inhibitor-like [Nasonia vitripennis]|uniref:TIL domain-containing protein n=1 Tax=Nasonia vitripennis TaxID=7425 RepID=A0A7M7M2V7_NASVI|nr:chymotrypsin inhibitor-like [Nasonia vitripennis]
MSKSIVLCLLVLCISASLISADSASSRRCPKRNQRWNNCGTACPLKCSQLKPVPCTKQCVIGCECIPGTVLRKDNECVSPKDCKKI